MSNAAARLWYGRAAAELQAAGRFRRIADALAATGADPAVVELARSAAKDEVRHFELCAHLVDHFGVEPPKPTDPPIEPLRSGAASERAQVLYEVIAMSCVTESLSTALLMQIRDEATDDAVRDVAHEVLRDEVRHARLGWAHLAAESRRLDLSFLGPRLPAMLAQTVADELFDDNAPDDSAVVGLGGLARPERRRVFVATMHQVVLPGLERFGVDTTQAKAWLDGRVARQ